MSRDVGGVPAAGRGSIGGEPGLRKSNPPEKLTRPPSRMCGTIPVSTCPTTIPAPSPDVRLQAGATFAANRCQPALSGGVVRDITLGSGTESGSRATEDVGPSATSGSGLALTDRVASCRA